MSEDTDKIAGTPAGTKSSVIGKGNPYRMTGEARAELRMKVAGWFYQNPHTRVPSTFKGLCQELEKSPDTIRAVIRKLPKTLTEYVHELEIQGLAQYMAAIQSMVKTAIAGKKDSVAAFRALKEIAREHDKAKPAKEPDMPEAVTKAFNTVIEAKRKAREKSQVTESTGSGQSENGLPTTVGKIQ